MSVSMMAEVWQLDCLRPSEKLLLLAIADHANDEGVCYPSADRLQKKCGFSTATYAKYSHILTDSGLITKKPRASTSEGRQTNLLTINHSSFYTCKDSLQLKAAREKQARPTPPLFRRSKRR